MLKNVASQKIGAQLVNATDGSAFTGSVTVSVTVDAGTQATGTVGSGACTHEGNGYHTYAPSQAETNGDLIAYTFTGSGAVPVTVQVYTLPTTGILSPATLGRTLVVDAAGLADANMVKMGPTGSGTAQTARDIGASVLLSSGTGTGQLDFTSGVVKANVTQFGGSNGTFSSGRPEVNTSHIAGSSVSTSSAQIGVNIVNAGGTAWASGSLTSGVFAAGAITASAIAADAIGASELAADAVAEIADAVWDEATSGHITSGTFGQALYPIRAATAQAGGATTITLDASASSTDDIYNYDLIVITAGTGAGQARYITDYVGSTKVATVATWQTNPSSDSVFVILPGGQIPGATAPTAGEVADAVWDEATSGHTTSGTFGEQAKTDVDSILSRVTTGIPNATAGSAGGVLIAGSNAATTFATVTCTGAFAINGGLGISSSGIALAITSTAANAVSITTEADTNSITIYRDTDSTGNILGNITGTASGNSTHSAADVWSAGTRTLTAGTNIQLPSNGLANVTAWTVAITGNITGNLSGSVGSVTGAVGSVTGNVGGNVTGSVGSVTGNVGGNVTGSVGSIATDGIAAASIATAAAQKLAHVFFRRTMANVEAASDGDTLSVGSLYGFIQQAQESAASGTTLSIRKTDGTVLGTKTLTTDASADPITGIT